MSDDSTVKAPFKEGMEGKVPEDAEAKAAQAADDQAAQENQAAEEDDS